MAINLERCRGTDGSAGKYSGEPFIRGKTDKKFAALFWILAIISLPLVAFLASPHAEKQRQIRIMKNCWSTIGRNTATYNRIMSPPVVLYRNGWRKQGMAKGRGEYKGETHYARTFTNAGDLVITYCEFIYQIVG